MGPPGRMGPPGAPGPTGEAGPTGPSGQNGNDGDNGPTGPKGCTGADGATGEQGNPGPTGPQGEQGPAGGPTGAEGPTGPAGEGGGNVFICGEGNPNITDPTGTTQGDIFKDSLTNIIYEKVNVDPVLYAVDALGNIYIVDENNGSGNLVNTLDIPPGTRVVDFVILDNDGDLCGYFSASDGVNNFLQEFSFPTFINKGTPINTGNLVVTAMSKLFIGSTIAPIFVSYDRVNNLAYVSTDVNDLTDNPLDVNGMQSTVPVTGFSFSDPTPAPSTIYATFSASGGPPFNTGFYTSAFGGAIDFSLLGDIGVSLGGIDLGTNGSTYGGGGAQNGPGEIYLIDTITPGAMLLNNTDYTDRISGLSRFDGGVQPWQVCCVPPVQVIQCVDDIDDITPTVIDTVAINNMTPDNAIGSISESIQQSFTAISSGYLSSLTLTINTGSPDQVILSVFEFDGSFNKSVLIYSTVVVANNPGEIIIDLFNADNTLMKGTPYLETGNLYYFQLSPSDNTYVTNTGIYADGDLYLDEIIVTDRDLLFEVQVRNFDCGLNSKNIIDNSKGLRIIENQLGLDFSVINGRPSIRGLNLNDDIECDPNVNLGQTYELALQPNGGELSLGPPVDARICAQGMRTATQTERMQSVVINSVGQLFRFGTPTLTCFVQLTVNDFDFTFTNPIFSRISPVCITISRASNDCIYCINLKGSFNVTIEIANANTCIAGQLIFTDINQLISCDQFIPVNLGGGSIQLTTYSMEGQCIIYGACFNNVGVYDVQIQSPTAGDNLLCFNYDITLFSE